MSKLRLALGTAVLAASAAFAAPAAAFTCNAPINPPPQGVPGIVMVQYCSEGVRVLPTGEVTTVNQVGVTILGHEECVGQGRIVVDTAPPGVTYDHGGLFGTPVFATCP